MPFNPITKELKGTRAKAVQQAGAFTYHTMRDYWVLWRGEKWSVTLRNHWSGWFNDSFVFVIGKRSRTYQIGLFNFALCLIIYERN